MPDTRYAVSDDGVHIADQIVGDGPIDIVFVHSFVTHVELFWELPSFERLVRALSSFARVILFDKRGVGLSDRLSSSPTLEARIASLAGPSEILVSQTVRDLTAGSDLTFDDLGERELKGVPGRWRVNRVVGRPA